MLALALIALSAAAYVAAFPPWEGVALSWIALVPLLRVVDRAGVGAGRSAAAGAAWALLATAGVIAWVLPTLHGYFERPWHVSVALFTAVCLGTAVPYYAAVFAVVGGARARLPRTAWLLLVPVAWVVAEWARTRLGLRSAWALLGAAHHESERLRQIADLCGVYGVSAIVALANAVAYEAARIASARWRKRSVDATPLRRVGAVFAALLAAALGYGEWRRGPVDGVRPGTREVLLVQGDVDPELRWRRTHATRVLRRYGDLTRRALAEGGVPPALVVWPENALQTAPDDPTFGPPLRTLVARSGVPLLLGAPRSEADRGGRRRHFSAAHLVGPDGSLAHYDKMRLLPFSEAGLLPNGAARGDLDAASYSAGREPGLFDVAGERLGVLICFEAIYPELARAVARRGATVLVNLSNDGWYRGRGGARQHLQLAVFRAIETGLPLLRATTTGVTAVVAPDGRVVTRIPANAPGALRAALPPRRETPTVYARAGDLFAGACSVAWAAALAISARRGSRR